jgi:hypothetical protein
LNMTEQRVQEFVDALGKVVELMHSAGSFWS